jgi:hypothetical protein
MGGSEVGGESIGHLGAPALFAAANDDLPADPPVGLDEDVVDGPRRAQLAGRQGPLDGVEQLVILGRGNEVFSATFI